ncbi:thioesterase domain-containing protein [Actinokineospora inagensis]|uniref:thioesterase domain-containing protein n=1 Tax=Actinokineospora inagensis TaxID=103730 RepID=UPI00042064FB|nr:thioesterase domain-containing protein [Actinokineospora inagensis]
MHDNLVPLRGGGGPTVAFAHPSSGLATGFRRLVQHLTGPGPVYAFENLEPGPADLCSIAALGTEYWNQLRACAPGPLVLAGWSFGGPVALRMAEAAEADGAEVAHVVLIDSGRPDLLAPRAETSVRRLAGLFELDPDSIGGSDLDGDDLDREQALELVAHLLRATHANDSIEVADLRPFVEVFEWHVAAGRRPWRVPAVRTPVVLVRARDEPGWHDAPTDLGWSAVLGGPVDTHWTPGTHYDLMSGKNAPHLAALLNRLLARVPVTSRKWSDSRD